MRGESATRLSQDERISSSCKTAARYTCNWTTLKYSSGAVHSRSTFVRRYFSKLRLEWIKTSVNDTGDDKCRFLSSTVSSLVAEVLLCVPPIFISRFVPEAVSLSWSFPLETATRWWRNKKHGAARWLIIHNNDIATNNIPQNNLVTLTYHRREFLVYLY